MPKSPNYPVPALEKGLDVLETLAAAGVPQSLAGLAQRLERSSSELFRMLNCLERRGYLKRDAASGRYALTLKLYTLAHAHSPIEKLLRVANRPMQELTEAIRESCHLSVLENDKLIVVAQQESPERVRLSIEMGAVFDSANTASGRLLLAQLSESELAEVLPASRLSGRAKGATDLRATLAEIRRRGISTAESESIEGVRDVAVLVGKPEARICAALAVTRLLRPGQRGGEEALIAAMQKAADEITVSLGLGDSS